MKSKSYIYRLIVSLIVITPVLRPASTTYIFERKSIMKKFSVVSILLLVLFFYSISNAFVHPGINHTLEDLNRMKAMVAASQEPWLSGYNELASDSYSSYNYVFATPASVVNRGTAPPTENRTNMDRNCAAAYQNAIMWYITGNQAYANKSIQILNGWSSTLTALGGTDVRLLASLDGTKFLNAAEIIRHTNAGWTQTGITNFSNMMKNIFYPIVKDMSGSGNWSIGSVKFVMALGIFLDDVNMFNDAVNAYKYGAYVDCTAAVTEYIQPQGWNYESDRDMQHSQLGIGQLAECAQTAWNQGIDLYSYGDNRILTGYEYQVKHLFRLYPTFSYWEACDGQTNSSLSDDDPNLRPIYEMVWNHYVNRMGFPESCAYYTITGAESIRPEGAMGVSQIMDHPAFGTILFYLPTRTTGLPQIPTGMAAIARNGQVTLSWDSNSSATSYNLKRTTSWGGTYTTIANLTTNSYVDANVVNGNTYYYAVSAVNAIGESGNSGLDIARPTNTVPVAPTNLDAPVTSFNRVDLSWSPVLGASSYNVKHSTASGGPYTTIASGIGSTWQKFSDARVSAGTTYYYVVSANNFIGEGSNSAQKAATTLTAIPSSWNDTDVWQVGTKGSSTYIDSNSTFVIKGSGFVIGYNFDSFHFVYRKMNSSGTIIARLVTQDGLTNIEKVGLMMRETMDQDAKTAAVIIHGNGASQFGYRTSTGGTLSGTTGSTYSVPVWLKLDRTSSTFTGYVSTDGSTWTTIASKSISMNSNIYVGMAVCLRNTSKLTTSRFDNVTAPTGVSITSPSTPTGLTTDSDVGEISLDWNTNSATNISGYNIYRTTTSGSNYVLLNGLLTSDSSFIDDCVNCDTNYYYAVSAVDNASMESSLSTEAISKWVYGDMNSSGTVDNSDMDEFFSYWLTTECEDLDIDHNCRFNFYEFSKMALNWLEE